MNRLLILFVIIILFVKPFISLAQDTTKVKKTREFFFSVTDISPFTASIEYKRQLKKRTFFKIGLVNLNSRVDQHTPLIAADFVTKSTSVAGGLLLGLEFRKVIGEKFNFFHGPNIKLTYSKQRSEDEDPNKPAAQRISQTKNYDFGIPYTLGFLFLVNKNVLISAQINPEILIHTSTHEDGEGVQRKTTSGSFVFSNKYGLLSLVYRF